jgi:hypothetical protein
MRKDDRVDSSVQGWAVWGSVVAYARENLRIIGGQVVLLAESHLKTISKFYRLNQLAYLGYSTNMVTYVIY